MGLDHVTSRPMLHVSVPPMFALRGLVDRPDLDDIPGSGDAPDGHVNTAPEAGNRLLPCTRWSRFVEMSVKSVLLIQVMALALAFAPPPGAAEPPLPPMRQG